MRDALKSYLALAGGIGEVTRQRAVAVAQALVQQGEATAGQVSELAEDVLSQSRQNREAVTALVRHEVDRTLGRVGVPQAEQVTQLTARLDALEASLRALQEQRAAAVESPAPKTRAKAAAAAPAPAKTTEAARAKAGAPAKAKAGAPAKSKAAARTSSPRRPAGRKAGPA